VEREAIDGGDAYPLMDYMDDVRGYVTSELRQRRPAIGTQRRHLQRGYVEALTGLLTADERPRPSGFTRVDISQSDIRAAARAQLKAIRDDARRASGADAATRAHLDDLADRIDDALDTDA
jgi:hypothetical protein